jgi:hypothetical protein
MVGEHLTGYSSVNFCFLLIYFAGVIVVQIAMRAIIENKLTHQNNFYYPPCSSQLAKTLHKQGFSGLFFCFSGSFFWIGVSLSLNFHTEMKARGVQDFGIQHPTDP